jgi:hypothetical protein
MYRRGQAAFPCADAGPVPHIVSSLHVHPPPTPLPPYPPTPLPPTQHTHKTTPPPLLNPPTQHTHTTPPSPFSPPPPPNPSHPPPPHTHTHAALPASPHLQTACGSRPAVNSYDLLAIRPESEQVFHAACASLPVDIIALDLSKRMPFKFKSAPLQVAIARGVHFEVGVGWGWGGYAPGGGGVCVGGGSGLVWERGGPAFAYQKLRGHLESLPCRAVPCRAVPCRAVPCRAVPCRAVPCRAVPPALCPSLALAVTPD